MKQGITIKTQLGYGIASFADCGPYSFVLTYFMFFLTDVIGISPSKAGTISLIAIICNALFTILVGYMSDNTKSSYGRRIPYLAASALPLGLFLFLMFFDVDFSLIVKDIYYILTSIFFWISFSVFYIPYSALGAELTTDYNERAKLRNYSRVFAIIGNMCATVVPLLIISYLTKHGSTEQAAWKYTGLFVGTLSASSILLTLWFLRKQPLNGPNNPSSKNILELFKEYKQLLTLRPYIYLLFTVVFFTTGATIFSSDMIYFMKYKIGLSKAIMSSLYLAMALVGLVINPILGRLAVKVGKSRALMLAMYTSGILMLLFNIIGIDSFFMSLLHILAFTIGYASYWQLILSVVYDISEVDEFKYGKRREGSIMSLTTITLMIMPAVSMKSLGFILRISGYEAESITQNPGAIKGIEMAFTVIPAILFILAGICFMLYPLSQEKFNFLKEALKLKKEGKPYSTEGIEAIITKDLVNR